MLRRVPVTGGGVALAGRGRGGGGAPATCEGPTPSAHRCWRARAVWTLCVSSVYFVYSVSLRVDFCQKILVKYLRKRAPACSEIEEEPSFSNI